MTLHGQIFLQQKMLRDAAWRKNCTHASRATGTATSTSRASLSAGFKRSGASSSASACCDFLATGSYGELPTASWPLHRQVVLDLQRAFLCVLLSAMLGFYAALNLRKRDLSCVSQKPSAMQMQSCSCRTMVHTSPQFGRLLKVASSMFSRKGRWAARRSAFDAIVLRSSCIQAARYLDWSAACAEVQ